MAVFHNETLRKYAADCQDALSALGDYFIKSGSQIVDAFAGFRNFHKAQARLKYQAKRKGLPGWKSIPK